MEINAKRCSCPTVSLLALKFHQRDAALGPNNVFRYRPSV